MRWIYLAVFVLFFTASVSATTIQSESLILDMENSEAEAEIEVAELTSSSFTYITSANIETVSAKVNSTELDCSVETLALGDEIVCETNLKDNFKVNLNYSFSGLTTSNGELTTFRYSHPIYRPTERFYLRVQLPEGSGIAQETVENPITPVDGSVGSDGRTIYVEWNKNPQIGDTLNFKIEYENLKTSRGYLPLIIGSGLGALLLFVSYYYWKRRNIEDLESIYSELSDDQKEIIELLESNDGEMLQKDIVDTSDYSKAKISGLVSELVEKEYVEKTKEGRSNKLRISSNYKY